MRRLGYHGWAATLLIVEFLSVVAGIALGAIPRSPVSTLPNGTEVAITCGSPWLPSGAETAQCAASFGARGPMGLVLIGFGLALFGGQLLVGTLVAGIRDVQANPSQPAAVRTAGPEPSRPAPSA